MPVIQLRLQKCDDSTNGRPRHCPSCGSQILQRWGQVAKQINNGKESISIHRYRCVDCGKTFRNYPKDVDQSKYSLSLRRLAALMWTLGLSSRDIQGIFEDIDVQISHTTIWREGQKLTEKIIGHKVRFLQADYLIDKRYIHQVSSNFGVVLAVDIGTNVFAIVGTLDEFNPRKVIAYLKPLTAGVDIDIVQLDTSALDSMMEASGRDVFFQPN
jgi:transposase-like protein